MTHATSIQHAADLIDKADGLLITAGAGMGVDSGLPDFRGREGFWNAYPALGKSRIDFTEIASPQAFRSDPEMAWGSTVTGLTCIAVQCLTVALAFCWTGH